MRGSAVCSVTGVAEVRFLAAAFALGGGAAGASGAAGGAVCATGAAAGVSAFLFDAGGGLGFSVERLGRLFPPGNVVNDTDHHPHPANRHPLGADIRGKHAAIFAPVPGFKQRPFVGYFHLAVNFHRIRGGAQIMNA